MGGYLSLAIAARAPERVAGLALLGSRADAEAEERKPLRAELIATIRESGAEGMWRAMRPRLFPREAPAEVLRDARDIALSQKPDGLVAAVEAIRDRPDGTGVLASLPCPVLVVCGSEDPLATVDEQRAWADSARDGRLVVLDGAGHLPSLERPDELNPVLSEWLSTHWPAERAASGTAAATLPKVVDAEWLAVHLGEDDLVVGDVRGPNAHARHGHIAGAIPLVLGSPPPSSDPETLQELAVEVARRLGRHGVTPDKRLVLYDGGDCVGATASAQMAELAGHANVAVLAGGVAAWQGALEHGQVELEKVIRPAYEPNLGAIATREEIRSRLGDQELVARRRPLGGRVPRARRHPCDPRQGHIPGARNLEHTRLFAAPGRPQPPESCPFADRGCRTMSRSSATATRARARRWR